MNVCKCRFNGDFEFGFYHVTMWLVFFRSKLIKSVFKMKDDPASMQGVTQERAYELVTNDKIDDLLEEVLKGLQRFFGFGFHDIGYSQFVCVCARF